MRQLALALLLLAAVAPPLAAQRLRDLISELFIFGAAEDPLFLAGSGDPNNPTNIQVHGTHFVPSAAGNNAAVIAYLTTALAGSASVAPVSATSSGPPFRFEGGVPVRTAESPGPIFGERAETLGRGRMFIGANVSSLRFTTLRGADLETLRFTFTHTNVDFPGCDAAFGGDCTLMGVPEFENDVIDLRLRLELTVRVTSLFLTYGVSDRVDVGILVPIVSTSLDGRSVAQVFPFGEQVSHFFAGTVSAPMFDASRVVDGSATGVGDAAVRVKWNLRNDAQAAVALLADARFPTGSDEDLLGTGSFAARGLAIISARRGDFSPHVNVGYAYRAGDALSDALLGTAGFDQVLAPWATLAVDVVSELQVGDPERLAPEPVLVEAPFRRTIDPLAIPSRRDNIVDASLGFKFTTPAGLGIVANGAWPLNRGGLRPSATWTVGLEYHF